MTKDITINGTTYQLGRLSARDGSWVNFQFLSRGITDMLGAQKEINERDLGLVLTYVLPALQEDIFHKVKEYCFRVTNRYITVAENTRVPQPLFTPAGKWAVGGEPDSVTLTALLISSLAFNLLPFFEPGALTTLKSLFPDTSQSNSPESTDTSSDPLLPATGSTGT